ncbi:MAG: hypothetical protein HYZ17_16435 [Betaproteobacteria bacterium]|nr:hypothetical protein [Betaproteobacteria bacterium]
MSDSTSHLDELSVGQASKESAGNALWNAMSPNALFGRRSSTTSALTWGYYGGKYRKADGTVVTKGNATQALTDAATNYLLETDGTVSKVTAAPVGWPGPLAGGAKALYEIVCAGGLVTGYTDYRTTGIGAGPAGAVAAADVSIADAGTYFIGTDVEAVLQEVGAALGGFGSGDVVGPASSVDNRVVFFDGITGKLIKDSGLTLSGSNTGDQTSVSGNAGTATALETARTIGGESFDGTANITQPFDVHTFYPGVPTASAKLYRGKLARAVTFPANFSTSQFTASANATGSTVFDIQKNGSSVGSCTIGAGGVTPTFASSGGAAVSFAAGDILMIVSPASADATLADPAITLVGTR